MTCPRCNCFTYELFIRDEWATFRQWTCVNCGWRFQHEPAEIIPEHSGRPGAYFQPPIRLEVR